MKRNLIILALSASLASIGFAGEVERRTTTTTTSAVAPTAEVVGTGTITEYTPGTAFVVKETSGPIHYRYGKTVTYVTRSGETLTEEQVRTRVRVGSPVSVHYSSEGSERVISRVEVGE